MVWERNAFQAENARERPRPHGGTGKKCRDLISALEGLAPELEKGLAEAHTLEALESLRVDFLGRKGRLAHIMSALPQLEPAQRPAVGQKANAVKENLASLPGRLPWRGSLHPITLVTQEICDVLRALGFDVASGPEVENDFYNFESLNMPPEHPARDMQDTLYVSDKVVMRTHTSPVQVRTMLARKPPLAVICPGKVYRRDSDLTHTPMFHQIEGLMVGDGISMAHLRGTLTAFVRAVFGGHTNVRFRPSFFPFTEPSAEVDISCCICGGAGHVNGEPCRVCKTTGWVEILGCGMVDPAVFASAGYPEDVSGFAFGMGVERVAMLKYGIGDLRMFFENDVRFLGQFAG